MPNSISNQPHDLMSNEQDGENSCTAERVLIIGPVEYRTFLAQSGNLPQSTGAEFRELTAGFLAKHQPDLIVAPLLSLSFDILDVARRLETLGYRGRLRALTSPLPDVAAVEAEVRSYCPSIEFTLVIFPLQA